MQTDRTPSPAAPRTLAWLTITPWRVVALALIVLVAPGGCVTSPPTPRPHSLYLHLWVPRLPIVGDTVTVAATVVRERGDTSYADVEVRLHTDDSRVFSFLSDSVFHFDLSRTGARTAFLAVRASSRSPNPDGTALEIETYLPRSDGSSAFLFYDAWFIHVGVDVSRLMDTSTNQYR